MTGSPRFANTVVRFDKDHSQFAPLENAAGALTRAADQSGKGELRSLLAGPTAVAIGDGDEVELAKSLVDETRVLKTLKILGALIGGRALGADDVQSLARLPSRPQLQATIVGSLQAPLAQIVGVLTAAQGNLVRVLQARGSQ